MDLNQFAVKFNNPIGTSFTIFTCIIPSFFFLYSTYFLACKWRESNAKYSERGKFSRSSGGRLRRLSSLISSLRLRQAYWVRGCTANCLAFRASPYATGDWVISQHYIPITVIYKIGKCYSIKIKWKITQLRDGNIKSKNVTL